MADLTGKWDVAVHTFMGDQSACHELKADGASLMGTVTDGSNGASVSINDGKVDGKKFSYNFKIQIAVGNLEFFIEGEMTDDNTLKGVSKNAMGEFEFDASRI